MHLVICSRKPNADSEGLGGVGIDTVRNEQPIDGFPRLFAVVRNKIGDMAAHWFTDAQLKALLKQRLVVITLIQPMVGSPVGAVVADRIDL